MGLSGHNVTLPQVESLLRVGFDKESGPLGGE